EFPSRQPLGQHQAHPGPQPRPAGAAGGAPRGGARPCEGGSRCDGCQLQLAEQGRRMDCGHHRCKECEQGAGGAGERACLQCLEDQGKQLLNDLDRDTHCPLSPEELVSWPYGALSCHVRGAPWKVEEAESLRPRPTSASCWRRCKGAEAARGRLDQRLSEVEAQQKTLQNIVTVLSREMGRRDGARGSADTGLGQRPGGKPWPASCTWRKRPWGPRSRPWSRPPMMDTFSGGSLTWGESCSKPCPDRYLQSTPPPIYTSRYGYKLCLKVLPQWGRPTGAGTHISLFLVLMRGEYDFRLKWPFRHLHALDQAGERHISSSFQTADGSSSFQRPVSKCNIASGLPEFLPPLPGSTPRKPPTSRRTPLAFEALINASL
ncbi:unnamed protein product, partial [Lepidochelys kempii]